MRVVKLEALVEELAPVSRLKAGHGLLLVAAATIAASLFALNALGPRPHLHAVVTSTPGIVRAAMLLILGAVASWEVTAMVRPQIGRRGMAGRWALMATFLIPVAALLYGAAQEMPLQRAMAPQTWLWCLISIAGLSLGIGAFIVAWLRRGAPMNLARAGWLTGVAAGSLGAFAYSLHCPHGGLTGIAIWYSLAVAAVAVAGRLAVPPLIRW